MLAACAVLCAASLWAAGSAHASLNFDPALPFDEVPRAGADFDGDGLEDVVTTSGSNVVIHYSDGIGGFLGAEAFPAGGASPAGIVVEDFDADGFPDVATANSQSGDISVLLHDRTAGLLPAATFDAAGTPAGLVAADFDGDDHADLVVSTFQDDEVAFLAGDGQGAFGPAISHPAGGNPTELARGDFDGDGRADVAVAPGGVTDAEVQILLGRPEGGDGTVFEPPVSAGGGGGDKRLATGDLNGDGRTDLGILNVFSGAVVIVLGDDGRAFTPVTQIPASMEDDRADLVFADFDGDGLDDLVYGEYNPFFAFRDIVLSIGDGQGGFDFHWRFEALGLGARNLLALHLSEDAEVDVATDGGIFLGTALTLQPEVVQFPGRRVGSAGSPVTVVVENEGTVPYDVASSGLLVDEGAFALGPDACSGSALPVDGSCTIEVRFLAPAVGLHEDDLLVDTTAGLYGVGLVGEGIAEPVLAASPASVDFPGAIAGERSATKVVQVTNGGELPVTVSGVTFGGADAAMFGQMLSTCPRARLQPGASCGVPVHFHPVRDGAHSATLQVSHDGQGGTLSVPLTGTGTPPFTLSAAAVDFGAVPQGAVARRTITATRTPAPPRRVQPPTIVSVERASGPDSLAFGSSSSCRFSAPGTCTVEVSFSPVAARRHAASVTIVSGGYRAVVELAGTGTRPPTPNVSAALRSRLRAALRAWGRAGHAAALRRGLGVTRVRTPVRGRLRLVVRKPGGPVVARGVAQARAGVPASVRGRLTKAGRRLLRSERAVRLVATLELTATQDRRRSRARVSGSVR
jgi:hypothetical protein